MPDIDIFTGPGCGYCEAAKALPQARKLPFRERDISDPAVLAEFKERLPRVRAIPQIYADGEHVGGLENLKLRLGDSKPS